MPADSSTLPPRAPRRKVPRRFAAVAFSFYMAGIVALVMSLVLTAANTGLGEGYLLRVLKSYLLAMPVAFVCVMMVRPLVVRLVDLTIEPPRA